jgi:TonB family protein
MSRLILICLAAQIFSAAQTPAAIAPELPNDPREVFAVAAPFYDFNDSSMKPWHLKATYQLYDEKGSPSEQGTYEYWWASSKVYRSTWNRHGATHTDWHTADGKHAYLGTGDRLQFFEYKLQSSLISPLPDSFDFDPHFARLEREEVGAGNGMKLPCIMVVPQMPQHGQVQKVPLGLFPTYCFDTKLPILRFRYSLGTVTTEFNKIVKMQNHYLAREIVMFEGKRKILTAEVDSITNLDPADHALTPASEASSEKADKPMQVPPRLMQSLLLKKQAPVYPQDAKDAHVSGTVILDVTIGMDGALHDLHVTSTPWPSLTAAALSAVSHWEYKPYLLDGEPVEVQTTIYAIFSLGK